MPCHQATKFCSAGLKDFTIVAVMDRMIMILPIHFYNHKALIIRYFFSFLFLMHATIRGSFN